MTCNLARGRNIYTCALPCINYYNIRGTVMQNSLLLSPSKYGPPP